MDALATVAELGLYLKQPIPAADTNGAQLFLDIASDLVRDYLQQRISAVTGDVVVLDPSPGGRVFLPELPVTAVTKVETVDTVGAWTIVDPVNYVTTARTGTIQSRGTGGVRWPHTPGSWRVTYDHGWSTIPASLKGVVLSAAARAYSNPVFVTSESVGSYQVRYERSAAGFTPLEQVTLDRYRVPRVA